jgi:fumarylacetoacetase
VLDLGGCVEDGLFGDVDAAICRGCEEPALNALMALGPAAASTLRRTLHALLRADAARDTRVRLTPHLIPTMHVELALPARIGNYTDFFASIHHATNAWQLIRPGEGLPPNYRYVPLAYHGRASSIAIAGTDVRRPSGQQRRGDEPPVFGPTRRLDCELEVAFFIGAGNEQGCPIAIGEARAQLFGCCLLNDWSARDIQAWESHPLGPFLSKSFATTISPWVVTMDALEPFRTPAMPRGVGDPRPLPYLMSDEDQQSGGIGIDLEVCLLTDGMRREGCAPITISRGDFRAMYWTPAQLVAHHTSNGCNLQPGDLLATGTVSGVEQGTQGCLLELTRGGREPLTLPNGETRTFLEDGDEVILRGSCVAPGYARIGFGDCRGRVAS